MISLFFFFAFLWSCFGTSAECINQSAGKAFHFLQCAIHILMLVFLHSPMNPCALIRHEYFSQEPWLWRLGVQGMTQSREEERGKIDKRIDLKIEE